MLSGIADRNWTSAAADNTYPICHPKITFADAVVC
jgi:hypothetical protein